jgi:hypothetical protein
MAKVKVIKGKNGQKPISFKPGALHQQLNVAPNDKIPSSKMAEAASGADGALAQKRANFARNVLTGRKKSQ